MVPKKVLIAFLIISVCVIPVLAASTATATVQPAKYSAIKSAIDAGKEGLVWQIQNPNIYYVQYRISGYDPSTYQYSVKLFSNGHEQILDEVPVSSQYGTIQLHTKTYPAGTYWLNLMATLPEAQQDAFCQAHGYPCEISQNLDIIRMDIGSTKSSIGDEYQSFVSGAMERSGVTVRGAAWTNR